MGGWVDEGRKRDGCDAHLQGFTHPPTHPPTYLEDHTQRLAEHRAHQHFPVFCVDYWEAIVFSPSQPIVDHPNSLHPPEGLVCLGEVGGWVGERMKDKDTR